MTFTQSGLLWSTVRLNSSLFRNASAACLRSAISALSCWLIFAMPGSASALGRTLSRAKTVIHETTAVTSFTKPERRYHGCQKIVASMRWLSPHATMKAAKSQKIGRKGTSFRRRMKNASVSGMAEYAPKMAMSERMCSHPWPADHCPQCHRAGKPLVSKRCWRKEIMVLEEFQIGGNDRK